MSNEPKPFEPPTTPENDGPRPAVGPDNPMPSEESDATNSD